MAVSEQAPDPPSEPTSDRRRILTLLTDFGRTDYYVGAVRGTVLRRTPRVEVHLVDLSHEIASGDVEGASFLLAAAAPSFPEGTVHLAVVDPGVGSERRILAVRTDRARYVAPDNGLLTRIFDGADGELGSIRSVTRDDLFLDAPGQTFHGRDRFAPVAAFLLEGGSLEDLGPEVDDPVRLDLPPPQRSRDHRDGTKIVGRIVHVDRFGNLVTDVPADWLPANRRFSASLGAHTVELRVGHYREIPAGGAGVLVGSLGTLEVSLDGESLGERWRVERGETVVFRLPAEDPEVGAAAEAADTPSNT